MCNFKSERFFFEVPVMKNNNLNDYNGLNCVIVSNESELTNKLGQELDD